MLLIILTGAPASGKSSFAKSLSNHLSIPWFSKDAYKIELFERYGFNSHDEKKKLSIRGEALLIKQIEKSVEENQSVIIDNNFKDFDLLREILSHCDTDCKIICFYLYADSSALAARYNERIWTGKREQSLYTLNVYPVVNGISEFHKPLTAEQVDDIQSLVSEKTFGDIVFEINTNTLETDYDTILHQMIATIKENTKEL